ncbi:branched-chain amino acid ABC transporter permease [Acidocella facilis]|uniref:branched-chain amino acid ABC transporter permease n=1 Tax=Acidocella facilis TaxID=525 RepID=UPI001F17F63A|nr:branched-chain amino acid ABC transporter permease [Acidocella facilis]
MTHAYHVQRWTRRSVASTALIVALNLALLAGPLLLSANAVDHLTTLFVYVMLAITWNALAGYGGLVSVGQQLFFGFGAYGAIRLSQAGVPVYAALLLGGVSSAVLALIVSSFMLKLRAGEFAIGMWVLAALVQLLVSLDPIVQGATGTSLLALNSFAPAARRADTYWFGLLAMAGVALLLFLLLRSRLGAAVQAIRDNEEAARSVGVQVGRTKRIIFVLAALGAGMAGAVWLATSISFQPNTYFGVQWTAYMIFMTLVGGIGTFEGPILGAILFFAVEAGFGAQGVWYLIGIGAAAVGFALLLPQGIWGWVERRYALRLLPVGYMLNLRGGEAGRQRGFARRPSTKPPAASPASEPS